MSGTKVFVISWTRTTPVYQLGNVVVEGFEAAKEKAAAFMKDGCAKVEIFDNDDRQGAPVLTLG